MGGDLASDSRHPTIDQECEERLTPEQVEELLTIVHTCLPAAPVTEDGEQNLSLGMFLLDVVAVYRYNCNNVPSLTSLQTRVSQKLNQEQL